MKVRRGFVHVQHHVEHMEMGIPLLKALCVLNQSLRCPLAALRTAAAVIQIADLEDGLMEQLLLLALPDNFYLSTFILLHFCPLSITNHQVI